MAGDGSNRNIRVEMGGLVGAIMFIGWLFTIGYAKLVGLQLLWALLIWPYYLGGALR
jgi:hypothetical protein